MDVSQYLEIFIDETKEHLQSLNQQLLILETEPENSETINEIFRAAHSLKGMAGTMGFKRMQRLTHDMENVFSEIRNGKMGVTAELVDVLFKGLDALEGYLSNIQASADEGTEDYEEIIQQLNSILNAGLGKAAEDVKEQVQVTQTVSAAAVDTVSASTGKYKELPLAEYEKNAIAKADKVGVRAYGITVFVQEYCILKAARAFLVFKALESLGDVIKSKPEVQDIEDEKFDLDFSVVLLTKEDIEKVRKTVLSVSEIKEVFIEPIYVSSSEVAEEKEAAQTEEKELRNNNQNKTAAQSTVKQQSSKPVVNRSVRVDIEKLDVLMNLVSELIIAKNGLVSMNTGERISKTDSGFNEQIEYLERVTTNLHESVMKVRMVPIESVLNRFPRMIRDLSKSLNKKMELYMTGEETELDRTVIDEIGDPLMHLLRNAADHGLESNEERVAKGKPAAGSIYLDAYQDGNNVVIEVRDDGAGINVEKVKRKAVEKGTITNEQADVMSDKEIIDLLFKPSFSTAEVITDVSGRGVGLDVVKTKIEALGGDIEAKTKLGAGSNFIIRLPLTLAIIQALMVELGSEKYAIPLGSIQTIEDVAASDIKYVHSKEVINLRGNVIPLLRLNQILDVPGDKENQENMIVVIISKGDRLAGLVVDNLIGQQEIVIKSIGKFINNNKIIGGATILGDGEVALILDVNTLV
ncbi:chemotaxis protein CheA [Anaerocolumna sp. AGMB13020]|uniref:chemotaxis protein CheA n=1 Tax=Anaerocolumna sp. AGMB13020 TaxID=3081750 RepID=UPI0029542BE1|nr:chemotaxis protein CheA [Anaerocolumna sp. AGMB13020]WOO36553.1 chemotaxis protein CheA [Anaerocolumna sp. AGMB13020]